VILVRLKKGETLEEADVDEGCGEASRWADSGKLMTETTGLRSSTRSSQKEKES
jgi:hypothetical protein